MTTQKNNYCKAVVINPETKSIYEIQISKENTLAEWYETIGNNCTLVCQATSLEDEEKQIINSLLMDDEILLRPEDIKGAISYNGRFYFNTCIFTGVNEEGETCDTTIIAEELHNQIYWLEQQSALILAERIINKPIIITTL